MKKYYNSPAADVVRIDSGDLMNASENITGIGVNDLDNVLDVSTWGMWEG